MRPKVSEAVLLKPKTEGELTDAPLEDDVLHGDGQGEDEEAER